MAIGPFAELGNVMLNKTVENFRPAACRREYLDIPLFDIRIEEKPVGDLAVSVVFRQHDHMGPVDIDAHDSSPPSIKDCTTSEPKASSPSKRCWVGSRWLLRPSTQVFSLENLRIVSSLWVVMTIWP